MSAGHGNRPSGTDRIARAIQGAPPIDGWPVEWPCAFQDQPIPPRRWCLDGWVPDKVVTILSGDGGTGKSLLAQHLGTCCAMGLPFMGIELARRKVLYLSAEDDLDELKRRQADINHSYGIDFGDLDQQLCWRVLTGDDALLVRADGKQGRALKATPTYENLKGFCVRNGIQLVIVDTVADTFGGLEIDRQQVTKYVRLLEAVARAMDGAVIALAHPGVAGLASGSGISGSTAWRNAVRSVIYMRRPTSEEADGPEARDLRIVERLKGNFAAAGAQLRVAWWQGCFAPADRIEVSEGALDVIATEVKVLAAVRRAHQQGRRMTFSKNSGMYAPRILKTYREVDGLKLHHIETAVASMLARGELREAYVGRPSHERAYIVPGDAPPIAGERTKEGSE